MSGRRPKEAGLHAGLYVKCGVQWNGRMLGGDRAICSVHCRATRNCTFCRSTQGGRCLYCPPFLVALLAITVLNDFLSLPRWLSVSSHAHILL